jgi:hypothetical protein
MLETIREYAAECMAAMPEAERVRSAHAAAFLALVEADGRPHTGLARKEWLELVDTEHSDIEVVTGDVAQAPRPGDGAWPVILVRPDGHVAARGRPGSMEPVTGYLRDLFREPAGYPRSRAGFQRTSHRWPSGSWKYPE